MLNFYYFLKLNCPINEELIKERTGKSLKDFIIYIKRFIIKNYNKKNILQGMGEILNESQKTWAKDHLISETIKELENYKK